MLTLYENRLGRAKEMRQAAISVRWSAKRRGQVDARGQVATGNGKGGSFACAQAVRDERA